MFTILWWLVLLAHAVSPASSQDKSIFLLAGQSNMSGQAGIINGTWDGAIPPECAPNPSILRLAANVTWVPAVEPLHRDIDVNVTVGMGPGMSFANSVALARAGPFLEIVREAQLGLDLPNVKCVDAQGLELKPDH
ncbi:hypothetical protein RHGRI_021807 [Rhododendron griersonianum]|uniref:Sialate O-acetylesterase domain-containing protein n=1 Tax=Rhododendron griersonianum TaxID=479676 RepID=A0AAV6JNA5_9ERIC|nr:hypothetical protein RHGRI_021807 [Rhododendron griersonianum]